MRPEARKALADLRALSRFDDYMKIARAELASDPHNAQLRAWIDTVDGLVTDEKAKLLPAA